MSINNTRQESEVLWNKEKEQEILHSIRTGLSLRKEIEKIVDQIWEKEFDGIWFIGIGGTYASAMQAEVYMRGRSTLPVYAENAAEFTTTGNKRFTARSAVIFSSVSGETQEMIAMVRKVREIGGTIFSFIDTPDSTLTHSDMYDYLIVSPKNEQLKFYMVCQYLIYKNREFPEYEDYCLNMEEYLPQALAETGKEADAWAKEFAQKITAQLRKAPDMPFYLVASGNQYGAVYSHGMCYWEEQLWIRTRVCSCQEFFHGMLEVITRDTPVILYMGEDEQRPLAERVARFLPKVCGNYTIIDTREYPLTGIREEYRGSISHLVMRAVNDRIDAWLEYDLDHPLSTRRYYRQFEY